MFILNSDQFINKLQYLVNCGKQHSCLPQLCYTQLIDVTIVVAFVELSTFQKKDGIRTRRITTVNLS